MDNSILTTLATIHAAILSIVLAATVAFFLYSYEKIAGLQESLDDRRYQISQLMQMPTLMRTPSIDYFDYVGEDGPDLEKIQKEFFVLSGISYAEEDDDIRNLQQLSQEEGDERLLDLLVLLTVVDPYSDGLTLNENGTGWGTGEPRRKKYTLEWESQLRFVTQTLLINRTSIMERLARFEASNPIGQVEELRKGGFYTSVQQMATGLFQRIERLQRDFIPKIIDSSYKLTFYQEAFETKNRVTWIALICLFNLIIGIIVPLFLHLHMKPPILERVQTGLLFLTMAPYGVIIFIALRAVSKLRIP